jgi:hypothetical protein
MDDPMANLEKRVRELTWEVERLRTVLIFGFLGLALFLLVGFLAPGILAWLLFMAVAVALVVALVLAFRDGFRWATSWFRKTE